MFRVILQNEKLLSIIKQFSQSRIEEECVDQLVNHLPKSKGLKWKVNFVADPIQFWQKVINLNVVESSDKIDT